LAASGAMTETIPPSLVLITIGSVTGVSIAGLFTGGLLPAAVCTLALVLLCYRRSRGDDMTGVTRAPLRTVLRTGLIAVPALVLPFLIRAAVVEGIATATEVSTVGVAYAVVAGLLVYRRFDLRRVYPMLVNTAALSGAIMLIIGMATAMGWALTQSGFSSDLVSLMVHMPGGRAGFLAVSIVTFAVLGSVLEGIPAMVLFGPLLFPAAKAIGVNEIHYAMVTVLSMGLGLFAPPFGLGFYFSCAIGGASPDQAMRRVWPYLLALLLAVIVVAAVPWLSVGLL
jgi:tripartite ATP-independent transporter DctM subunit